MTNEGNGFNNLQQLTYQTGESGEVSLSHPTPPILPAKETGSNFREFVVILTVRISVGVYLTQKGRYGSIL